MHDVRIHVTAYRGDQRVALDDRGSHLLTHELTIDGESVRGVQWHLYSDGLPGFLVLEFYDPPEELRERFPLSDVLAVDDLPAEEAARVLRLPVSNVELVEMPS
jgi:hypothetical protein